jgi:hypothetical protein
VNAVIDVAAPVAITVLPMFKSAPLTATDISNTLVVALDCTKAAHPTVPPALVASCVIVLAVRTPSVAVANALVLGNARLATIVFPAVTALDESAGCTPAYSRNTALVPRDVVIWSSTLFLRASLKWGFADNWWLLWWCYLNRAADL